MFILVFIKSLEFYMFTYEKRELQVDCKEKENPINEVFLYVFHVVLFIK